MTKHDGHTRAFKQLASRNVNKAYVTTPTKDFKHTDWLKGRDLHIQLMLITVTVQKVWPLPAHLGHPENMCRNN